MKLQTQKNRETAFGRAVEKLRKAGVGGGGGEGGLNQFY